MRLLRSWGWLASMLLGYLLFHGVMLAETAYSVPRLINPDTIAMVSEVMAWGLDVAPIHWFATGPAQRFPHLNLALFFPAVTLLGIGYLAALRAIRRDARAWPFRRLLAAAVVTSLPLLALLPPTSVDYLSYLFAGRVTAIYHLSPWHHALGEFPAEHNYLTPYVWGPALKCNYGPAWVAVMAAVAGLANLLMPGDLTLGSFLLNVLLLRAANLAALAAAALAVWQINGLLWPRQQRLVTAAFLFNPLLVYEAVGALHNDVWGVACLLWACYLFLRDDIRFVVPLALSILIKYIVLAMLPLIAVYYWRQRDWRRLGWLGGAVAGSLGLAALTATEYLTTRLAGQTSVFGLSPTSMPQFLVFIVATIRELPHYATIVPVVARCLTLAFLPVYAVLVWRTHTREQVLLHSLWGLTLYLAGVYMQTMQWYFLWPLALLCATRWTPLAANAAWASWAVLLGYLMYFWNHNGWSPPSQVVSFLLALGLPSLACLAGRWGGWRALPDGEERTPGEKRERRVTRIPAGVR